MDAIEKTANSAIAGRATAFANFGIALMLAKGNRPDAVQIFKSRWPRSMHLDSIEKSQRADIVLKAPVAPGTTADPSWASPLSPLRTLGDAFIEYLRPLTVIGRMQGFRPMPFNVRTPRASMGSSVGWTGQNAPTFVSKMGFDAVTFKPSKITGIIAVTKELAEFSDPNAEKLIRTDLAESVAQFSDQQFLNPSIAAVTDVSPASITYGAPEVIATGTTLAAFTADLGNLLAQITTNMNAIHLVMRRSTALWICKMKSGDGSDAFPKMGVNGGEIWGIPVIVSNNAPNDNNSPADTVIVAIDADEILLNEGAIEFQASQNATIEMSSTPDSPATASTILVSCWQQGLLAMLVRRYVRWERRREGSVAILSGVPF